MKLAVISDIHGNHYALKEVLETAKKEGVERIFVLGDIVGYYYHPEIVLEMLSKWTCDIIKGNHEVILNTLKNNKNEFDSIKIKYGSGHEFALKNLDKNTLDRLLSLPTQRSIKIDSVTFQLNHGSPMKIDEYLYPDSNIKLLERCNSINHNFVLIGHSHYPFSYRCENSILINCGSIGQSRQKGGISNWCIIDTKNSVFKPMTTTYDTSALIKEIMLNDPQNEYLYKILCR